MRKYAGELRKAGYQVHYEKLGDFDGSFEHRLFLFMELNKSSSLLTFDIEDKFFEQRILAASASRNIEVRFVESPMFLTSRATFRSIVGQSKKPFMKSFYEAQRKRLKILIDKTGAPIGGEWSFDKENRKKLPQNHRCPPLPIYRIDSVDREVIELVDREFEDHPGRSDDFWLPTDRAGARGWALDFFKNRFHLFGPYEDAISSDEPFLYHSVLTPFLNVGLLEPSECINIALKSYRENLVPLNSCEGFVRQIIGWREFIRGIYQNYSEEQETRNFFNHHCKLSSLWYSGKTGIPPLDDVIRKTQKYGYAHHIERLMVVGSLMLLLEIEPREAHRWFMEMFIDSSDWVMGPNVYGMALFSDGGVFATKPYICGSNYYRKMSGVKPGDWCTEVDGLYWMFIKKHRDFFAKNPRSSMMVKTLNEIPIEKLRTLELAANNAKERLVSK